MTRMTTVTTNDNQDDGQCKDDWWWQYTCCASCTAEPGEEEPAEEQRWHFHISDDLGDKKSHDGGDKKMVTGSARLVVTLKTEALSLHSWWQKIFGQQNKKTDPFPKKYCYKSQTLSAPAQSQSHQLSSLDLAELTLSIYSPLPGELSCVIFKWNLALIKLLKYISLLI